MTNAETVKSLSTKLPPDLENILSLREVDLPREIKNAHASVRMQIGEMSEIVRNPVAIKKDDNVFWIIEAMTTIDQNTIPPALKENVRLLVEQCKVAIKRIEADFVGPIVKHQPLVEQDK